MKVVLLSQVEPKYSLIKKICLLDRLRNLHGLSRHPYTVSSHLSAHSRSVTPIFLDEPVSDVAFGSMRPPSEVGEDN